MSRAPNNQDPGDDFPPPAVEAKRPIEVQKRRGLRVWVITALAFVVAVVAIVVFGTMQ